MNGIRGKNTIESLLRDLRKCAFGVSVNNFNSSFFSASTNHGIQRERGDVYSSPAKLGFEFTPSTA